MSFRLCVEMEISVEQWREQGHFSRLLGREIFCVDSGELDKPVVFVDTGPVLRYMTNPARRNYAKWGDAVGKSIFACHNEDSCRIIKDAYAQLEEGAREVMIIDTERHRVYMRAVRDESGVLAGYYERYDLPVGK